jgi:hypothetical protein
VKSAKEILQENCVAESIKFQKKISNENCTAKGRTYNKEISWKKKTEGNLIGSKSMKTHTEIS